MPHFKSTLAVLALHVIFSHVVAAAPGDFKDVFVPPGSGGLDSPTAMTFGPDGNLYIVGPRTPPDGPRYVARYDGTTGEFMGAFTSGIDLVFPTGLTFGPDGNLYVLIINSFVARFDGETGEFLDDFVPFDKTLNLAWHLTFGPDGNFYVASLDADVVARFDGTTGEFIDTFASGGGLLDPHGLAFGPDGNLYVSSTGNDRIIRYAGTTGQFIDIFASGPEFAAPGGLRFGPLGDLFATSLVLRAVLRYDGTTGEFKGVFASDGGLGLPYDLDFGPDGNLYVTDQKPGPFPTDRVLRYQGLNHVPATSPWSIFTASLLLITAGLTIIASRRDQHNPGAVDSVHPTIK